MTEFQVLVRRHPFLALVALLSVLIYTYGIANLWPKYVEAQYRHKIINKQEYKMDRFEDLYSEPNIGFNDYSMNRCFKEPKDGSPVIDTACVDAITKINKDINDTDMLIYKERIRVLEGL